MNEERASLFLLLGSLAAGLAVVAGAFGTHSLKGILDDSMLAAFDTAARYQMYHGLGLCVISGLTKPSPHRRLVRVGWLFIAGIVLFCGSLYALAFTGIRWLGVLTPLGGLAFIAGWSLLAWHAWSSRRVS